MRKVLYDIQGTDLYSVVCETTKSSDITGQLKCFLENAADLGWDDTFENDTFYIEYKDGTVYEAGPNGEYGKFHQRNITRAIWYNSEDTVVYGTYTVNEFGNVA